MKLILNKDQRGLAPVILVAIVAVVLVVAGAGYYFISRNNSDENSNGDSVSSKQVADECKKAIDDKDLCKLFSSYTSKGEYTISMTTEGSQGGSGTIVTKYKDNDYHSVVKGGGFTMETISSGDYLYTKALNGGWTRTKITTDDAEDDLADFSEDFEEVNAKRYTAKGKEACGSLTCFVYEYEDPENKDDNYTLYFDDKDYLIRKFVGAPSDGGRATLTWEYGSVTITPPTDYTE